MVRGLLLCDDLIFSSRVTTTARSLGLIVGVARSATELLTIARQEPPSGVLIDLQNPGLDLTVLLNGLRQYCPRMPRVLAYGSHVQADVLRQARQAGCDPVLPRSRFVECLPESLADWLADCAIEWDRVDSSGPVV